MYINNGSSTFTQREIVAAIQLWNRAAVSLLDIRHNLISPGEALRGYRLPSSAFIYTSGGKAEVLLNDTPYNIERSGLFHGGRGTVLTITPQCDWLEYYMVLYKTGEPAFNRREYAKMLEQTDPFRQQYGFTPDNPVFLWELLRRMFEAWRQPTPLDHFYEKTAFYQLVYEIYKDLESGKINVLQPDTVEMARRYMDEHFGKSIAIQDICDMLGISYSHFHRSFKKQTGTGPQEYLINVRIAAAKRLLKSGCASIPDIAEFCGFQDERNFRRSFLKNTGLTPNAYREELPSLTQDHALGNVVPFPYNWESQVNLGKPMGKGANEMLKHMKGKAVIAAALLLMLLMSACATAPANSAGADVTPTPAVTSQVTPTQVAEPVEEGTRTISTVMGDVEVPVNPKNILVNFYTGDVLAFGITPVAIDKDSKLSYTPYADIAKDIPQVSFWNSPEELIQWEPDVIILAGAGGDGYYEKASKIAPVIVCPRTLSERITLFGELFGMEEKAQQLLQEYESKVESTKEKIKTLGLEDKTFSIVEATEDGGATIRFFHDDNGRGGEIIYTDLGLSAPEKLVEQYPDNSMTVSMEVVSEYVGDFVFYSRTTDDFDYSNVEIWNSLPAVKNGNVIEFDGDLFYHHDIISTNNQLEIVQEALLNLAGQ